MKKKNDAGKNALKVLAFLLITLVLLPLRGWPKNERLLPPQIRPLIQWML